MPKTKELSRSLAARLIGECKQVGFKQKQIADCAGISPSAVSLYATEGRIPDIRAAMGLAPCFTRMLGRPIKWEDLVENNVSGETQSSAKDLSMYPMLAASYFDELRQEVHALRERLDSTHERLDVRLNQQHDSINKVAAELIARFESLSEGQAILARGLIWLAENLDLTQDLLQKHPYLPSLAKQVGKRKDRH